MNRTGHARTATAWLSRNVAARLPRPATTRTWLLILAAVSLALAVGGLAPAAATINKAAAPVSPRAAHAAGPLGRALALPGLHSASYPVTLITGDQVMLTAVGGGRYSVSATPVPRPGGAMWPIRVTARGGSHGATSVRALPADVEPLASAGRVDTGLFDLKNLIAHGDTGSKAKLQVIVQYTRHLSAAALARHAMHLPGATQVTTLAANNAAKVAVAARHAAAFWAALAGYPGATSRPAIPFAAGGSLAQGVAKVWLAGDTPPAPPAQPTFLAGQAVSTLTVDIQERHDASICQTGGSTICVGFLSITGIAGPESGAVLTTPDSVSCPQPDCSTVRLVFHVPPGVYYSDGFSLFQRDSRSEWVELVDPQILVAGDTSVTLRLDDAKEITVAAPQPTDPFSVTFGDFRSLPDGNFFASFVFAGYGYGNYWVIPGQRVSTGTFHLTTNWVLGRPLVSMTVPTDGNLALHPTYPHYWDPPVPEGAVRFSGRQTLPLVDAGAGTSQDFAGLDARGKLVLMRMGFDVCNVLADQLTNAIKAGAAGVVVDPTQPLTRTGSCEVPGPGDWEFTGGTAPQIPFVFVPRSEADTLRGLLSRGNVLINVNDSGPSPYLYSLALHKEGMIPSSLSFRVTSDQLATLDTSYHDVQFPGFKLGFLADNTAVFRPNDWIAAATSYTTWLASVREFAGPVYPDMVRHDQIWLFDAQGNLLPSQEKYDAFARRGVTESLGWREQPRAPGIEPVPAAVLQAQPRFLSFEDVVCAACRQGDTFYPFMHFPSPDGLTSVNDEVVGIDPASVHLFQGGKEIPQTLLEGFLPTYQLPAQQARYRLTLDAENTHTAWDFPSSTPASDQTPPGYFCSGSFLGSTDPCRAEPLIFLSYHAGVNLNNAVTAPGAHLIQVSAYHQAPDAPAVTNLRLWISTDGGAVWQQAHITGGQDGTFTAAYTLPALSQTTGTVSIKAEASDAVGDDVTQTIIDAFGLVAGTA